MVKTNTMELGLGMTAPCRNIIGDGGRSEDMSRWFLVPSFQDPSVLSLCAMPIIDTPQDKRIDSYGTLADE